MISILPDPKDLMNPQVDLCKQQLSQCCVPDHEILARKNSIQGCIIQRLIGINVGTEASQKGLVFHPVFVELTRKLNRIPLHQIHSRRPTLINLGKHVLRGVPKFVKQRAHFVQRHEAGSARCRWSGVHDKQRHR